MKYADSILISTSRATQSQEGHFPMKYRKIPLIRPGCIYGQRKNLMDLYLGVLYTGGAYTRKEKHFNLQSVKLITFLSFFQIL